MRIVPADAVKGVMLLMIAALAGIDRVSNSTFPFTAFSVEHHKSTYIPLVFKIPPTSFVQKPA